MIKYSKLPYYKDGYNWSISPFSGSLIKEQGKFSTKNNFPLKVSEALKYCDNPYLCKPYDTVEHKKLEITKNTFDCLNRLHSIFISLSNKRFFLSRLYANFHNPLFTTTADAMKAISQIHLQSEQKNGLCLQRSLLAVKTSNSFQINGVLFIGALLPTTNMHAWIIENGTQPDINDREWILYRPLLAFYFN